MQEDSGEQQRRVECSLLIVLRIIIRGREGDGFPTKFDAIALPVSEYFLPQEKSARSTLTARSLLSSDGFQRTPF